MTPHPDAALLDLCCQLSELQAEWQRLYDATPDDGPNTAADDVWKLYASTVWPGAGPAMTRMHSGDDLAAQLLTHRATTLEGMAAKAAAILALQNAAGYTMDIRDDHCQLAASLMEDVAGAAYRPLGNIGSSGSKTTAA